MTGEAAATIIARVIEGLAGADYELAVTADTNAYLDLTALHRNLVTGRLAAGDYQTRSVMVKGGD